MRISDDEFQEWHDHIKRRHDRFKYFIQDIVVGVPKIHGMASEYREMSLKEIKERAKKLLDE